MFIRIACTCFLVAVLAGCAASDSATAPATPTTVDVFTTGDSFSPFSVVIPVGSTVRFNIAQAPDGTGHNVIFAASPAGAPANINVVTDTLIARTFAVSGTFSYSCTVHPGMTGEIVVQ
jgi:plastocyanin